MAILKRTQKIVAYAYNSGACFAWRPDGVFRGFGYSTVYLYAILTDIETE